MAGKQHQEPDDVGRWQSAHGMRWPHWLTLKRARRQYQVDPFTNDRSRVHESPKCERAPEQRGA
jgi:hypothetical protein